MAAADPIEWRVNELEKDVEKLRKDMHEARNALGKLQLIEYQIAEFRKDLTEFNENFKGEVKSLKQSNSMVIKVMVSVGITVLASSIGFAITALRVFG